MCTHVYTSFSRTGTGPCIPIKIPGPAMHGLEAPPARCIWGAVYVWAHMGIVQHMWHSAGHARPRGLGMHSGGHRGGSDSRVDVCIMSSSGCCSLLNYPVGKKQLLILAELQARASQPPECTTSCCRILHACTMRMVFNYPAYSRQVS